MSKIIKENDTVVIKPEHDLVGSISNSFRSELYTLLIDSHTLLIESPKELIIDFAEVNIIDSTGIGVIIAAHNSLRKKGGKLRIRNLSKVLYDLFITMHLDQHFKIEAGSN